MNYAPIEVTTIGKDNKVISRHWEIYTAQPDGSVRMDVVDELPPEYRKRRKWSVPE